MYINTHRNERVLPDYASEYDRYDTSAQLQQHTFVVCVRVREGILIQG
jgi:hypothetical protein